MPFTFEQVPDYPAHLEIDYPEHLSRGPVLVKSWLLAIPHLVVVGFLVGGIWLPWQSGLMGLLAFVALIVLAVIVLAVRGRYLRPLFDLLGLDRWACGSRPPWR